MPGIVADPDTRDLGYIQYNLQLYTFQWGALIFASP